jgi:hypothetical protein
MEILLIFISILAGVFGISWGKEKFTNRKLLKDISNERRKSFEKDLELTRKRVDSIPLEKLIRPGESIVED